MQTFFNQRNNLELGKIIHVGAGACNELNDYIAQGFTDILLVEPNPKVFKQLQSKVTKLSSAHSNVHILLENVALSGKQDEQIFYITKPHRYSGLYKAEQLKSLFQNLKTEQEITVKSLKLSNLIDKVSLDENKNNTLVIQVNGAEHEVLSSLTDKQLLQFSSVNIQHAKRDCFEGATSKTDLITLMEDKGFQLALEEKQDIVFGQLIFRKDERALQIASLNEKITEQNKTHSIRISKLENQLKASDEAKSTALNKSTKLEAQLAEVNKNKSNRISELEQQLKVTDEAKSAEKDKAAKASEQNETQRARITELEQQLKTSNESQAAELEKSTAAAEQNQVQNIRINELETFLNEDKKTNAIRIEELTKEKENQTHLHHENKKWAEHLNTQIEQLKVNLAENSQSVSLGQKIIAKSQSDLDNLRESYREKVESEKELVQLITELREKLIVASKYYHQLQQEHPELLSAIEPSSTEKTSHENGAQ